MFSAAFHVYTCSVHARTHVRFEHCCDAFTKQASVIGVLIHVTVRQHAQPLFALFYVSNTGSRHRYEDDTVVASTMGTLPPGHFLFTKGTLRPAEGALHECAWAVVLVHVVSLVYGWGGECGVLYMLRDVPLV